MPRYGFNFLWMFIWDASRGPLGPDERALDFMADMGFNFVRIPADYRFWTRDFDYLHPDESIFTYFDRYRVDPTQDLIEDFFVPDGMRPPQGVSLKAIAETR